MWEYNVKEKLPIFTNNSPSESLTQLLEEILSMQESFEWFVEGDVDNDDVDKKKNLIFQYFGRAFKRMPQHKRVKKTRITTFTCLTLIDKRQNNSFWRF